ncbi:mechanosensitive ion channel family protein [Sphingobacterium sp. SGG-5]|uniref:mechanosensitive ion channel family protein n=1 Tax=Sphingobacterium sp. SGG-5 TaxID=2710881 RepID=UPI001F0D1D88|nr:mechanosensitive ion channel family protein [Sphingobacterium sp. SGG-5]
MEKFETSIEKLIDLLVLKIPSIAIGLLLLVVGRYVIRFVLKLIERRFERRDVDISIRSFISSIIRFVLYVLLILTAANTMGIQTTSFIAALSAFGLAVGLALQGSLSNFAGGVLILLFRPFEVGDYISSNNGSGGTVERIDILYTTLIDDDGIRVFSPNGTLANSVIKNYTKITSRRMQFSFLVSYDVNMKVARETILAIFEADSRVLDKPQAEVVVGELKDGGVVLIARAWAKRENFWATRNEIAENIQDKLDATNVSFPVTSIKVLSDQA